MIDHSPIRRSVFKIISQHPARRPAEYNELCDQFLPYLRGSIRSAIAQLKSHGVIEETGHQQYLPTGEEMKPTSASLLYNALLNKYNVGDEITRKELIKVATDLGMINTLGDSSRNLLVTTKHLTRMSRSVYRLEEEVADVPTLNELGALLPPQSLVWSAIHEFLPTLPNEMAEALKTDSISEKDILNAIDDLFNRECLLDVSSGSNENDVTFDGYIKSFNYKPSEDELIYYTFEPDENFSPKDVHRLCKLSPNQAHQALNKLISFGLVERVRHGVYKTLPLSNLQGVRQTSDEVFSELHGLPLFEELIPPSASKATPAEEAEVNPVEEAEVNPVKVIVDFDRASKIYSQVLKDRESFYDEIELKREEVQMLREQAKQILASAERIEATYITRERKLDQALEDAKKVLAPFVQ
jgi:hypothetical protein